MKTVTLSPLLLLCGMLGWTVMASLPLTSHTMMASSLTGEEILSSMDHNRDYKTMTYSGTMEIHFRGQMRVKTLQVQGRAADKKSFVEFTNPEDKGTRYLMDGKNLWIYFPDEQDTVKISGHLLKQGMMGSDVSYEDALEADTLSKKYDIELTGEETINGHSCYIITLQAKVKRVPYVKRKMWVDKEHFIAWKEEMYAKSGRLLKESNVLKAQEVDGRYLPVEVEMVSKLKKNSKTVFKMTDIQFDVDLPDDMFTQRYLQR